VLVCHGGRVPDMIVPGGRVVDQGRVEVVPCHGRVVLVGCQGGRVGVLELDCHGGRVRVEVAQGSLIEVGGGPL
jgi:hypothetical protein